MTNISPTNQQKLLVMDWARKVHTLEYAHRYESKDNESRNGFWGNTATIISAVVAGIVGLSIADNSEWKTVSTGISVVGSMLVARITGIQTNTKPSEAAEKHRYSSSSYEELRHRIEQLLVNHVVTADYVMSQLPILERDFEKLRQNTPNVTDENFKKGKDTVTKLGTYPPAMRFDPIP
ncbi:hypothetical protein GCM10028822_00180 [Hymenobacter terrigena]